MPGSGIESGYERQNGEGHACPESGNGEEGTKLGYIVGMDRTW